MFGMGIQELVVVGMVAVLLFGKRLPEVARSFGQTYSQFRKGLQEIQNEMTKVTSAVEDAARTGYSYSPQSSPAADDYDEPTAPRFELPAPASADNAETVNSGETGTSSEASTTGTASSTDEPADRTSF